MLARGRVLDAVTSYLKEMTTEGAAQGVSGFVCLQSTLCEGRYRRYVTSYVAAP